jgi:hypothetical protein
MFCQRPFAASMDNENNSRGAAMVAAAGGIYRIGKEA